jgi:hypothetical protein
MRIASIICLTVLIIGGFLQLPPIKRWLNGGYQKNITRTVAEFGREHSDINSDASAIRAAHMVDYISHYYVPSPEFRGPQEVEAALERQRRDSIAQVVTALERYTGLRYGMDGQRWSKWAAEQEQRARARKSSEQLRVPDTTLPLRTETNATPSVTESLR